MRLLRIDGSGTESGAIDFHPQITVVEGLRGAARARIVAGLKDIARGQVDGLTGEIEAQGETFALSTDSLGRLELPSGVDLVLSSGDIPGANREVARAAARRREVEQQRDALAQQLDAARAAADAASAERAAASEALAEARRDAPPAESEPQPVATPSVAELLAAAVERRDRAEAELAAADAALLAAEQAVSAAVERAASAADAEQASHARLAELREATTRAAGDVDEAQVALDPESGDAVDAASAELASATEALEAALDGGAHDAGAQSEPAAVPPKRDEARIAALEARRFELEQERIPVAATDTAQVEEAIARATDPRNDATLAHALADEWDEITAHLSDLGVDPDRQGPDSVVGVPIDEPAAVSAARSRVDEARRELTDVLASVTNDPLEADEIEALEAAHVEVLEAQERAEARFGGSKARRRLTEAREAEQAILDRLGFATYAEFMMSASRSMSASDQDKVDDTRRTVDRAEQALAEAEDDAAVSGDGAGGSDDAELTSVSERFDQLLVDIAELLGHEIVGDPTDELRRVGVASTQGQPANALRQALSQVGMALEDADFQTDTLVALARVWLAEQHGADTRRDEIGLQLADIDAELAELGVPSDGQGSGGGASDSEAMVDTDEPEAVRTARDRVAAAQADLSAAHARAAAHEEALAEVVRCEAAFADAQSAEDELAAHLGDHEAGADGDDESVALAEAVREASDARQAALAELAEARDALDALPDPAVDDGAATEPEPAVDVVAELEAALVTATERVAATSAATKTLEVELAGLDGQVADAVAAQAAVAADSGDGGELSEETLEDIEWYLLSRLADRRQVSVAGSLPLVLDDPFEGLSGAEATRLVSAIERLAGAVQIILFTDDQALVDWAEALDPARAGVVHAG